MPLYVIATDILTLLRVGHPEVSRRITTAASPDELATAVISVDEVLSGWHTVVRQVVKPADIEEAYGRLAASVALLARFRILNFTQSAIARFDRLVALKLNIKKNDLRIAAIALENGAIVVTRNVRDFSRVPALAVDDWSQPPAPPSP